MQFSKEGLLFHTIFKKGAIIPYNFQKRDFYSIQFSKEGLLFHCNSGDFILIVPLTNTNNNEKGLMSITV